MIEEIVVSAEEKSKEITLISKEVKEFKLSKEVVFKFGLVKDLLEDADEPNREAIRLPNASSQALEKVITYCEYYKDKNPLKLERPLIKHIEELVCDCDKEFLNMDVDLLLDLIMTAYYSNIPSLLELTCGKLVSMMKGKSIEQLREFLGIDVF